MYKLGDRVKQLPSFDTKNHSFCVDNDMKTGDIYMIQRDETSSGLIHLLYGKGVKKNGTFYPNDFVPYKKLTIIIGA